MKKNIDKSGLFRKITNYRNNIFLLLCLVVHASFFSVFLILGAVPLALINSVSVICYVLLIFFSKSREKSEKATIYAYFEIIIFSFLCEIFTRNTFGFIYYVIGTVPVVFYLCPLYGKKRFFLQIFGAVSALLIHNTQKLIPNNFFPQLYKDLLPYSNTFNFINLVLTLFTILFASFFYELELTEIKKELSYSSMHDPLTGLYNRRFLYDNVIKEGEGLISVVLFDIDNFKKINDRFGHDTGDKVLETISSCIDDELKEDMFYPVRWGGEEFVLCYKDPNTDSVYKKTEHLCRLISEKLILPDNTSVTVTAGIASGKCSEFDSVVKTADEYLYLGKENGKNCIVCIDNENEYTKTEKKGYSQPL